MALHIRDERTDALVRGLASKKGVELTEAVREAVENELARERQNISLEERLKPLLDHVDSLPRIGSPADKAFYDGLWGQEND